MVEAYAFAGTTMTVLVPGQATGGAFTVLHVIKPSGCSTPPHSHDAETELPYVLAGTLRVETEGRRTSVGIGECVKLPPGRPHRLFNESGADVREFLLCAPAQFDRFIAAAGTPVAHRAQPTAMTDEDRKRLVTKASEFGIQLLASATPQGVAHRPALYERESLDVPGMHIEVLARLGNTATDLVLLRGLLAPESSLTLSGDGDPGCLFVIGGEVEVAPADASRTWERLGPEEAMAIDPAVRHHVRARGTTPVGLLMVATARRMRSFVTVLSAANGELVTTMEDER